MASEVTAGLVATAAFECTLATRLSRTHSARLALCSPSLAHARTRGGMRAGACPPHVLIYGAAAGAAVARGLHMSAGKDRITKPGALSTDANYALRTDTRGVCTALSTAGSKASGIVIRGACTARSTDQTCA